MGQFYSGANSAPWKTDNRVELSRRAHFGWTPSSRGLAALNKQRLLERRLEDSDKIMYIFARSDKMEALIP